MDIFNIAITIAGTSLAIIAAIGLVIVYGIKIWNEIMKEKTTIPKKEVKESDSSGHSQ